MERAYEVVIHAGALPPLKQEAPSDAELDFIDLVSNPKRRREYAQWSHDVLATWKGKR